MKLLSCPVLGAIVLSLIAIATAIHAREKPDDPLLGTWKGSLDLGPAKLRLVFVFETNDEGEREAFAVSPDQSPGKMPVTVTSLEGRDVVLDIKPVGAKFSGRLAADGKSIAGDFRQNGQSFPLVVAFAPGSWEDSTKPEVAVDDAGRLVGTWTGKLNLGAMSLTLVFECKKEDDGSLGAVLVSPDQSEARAPVMKITLEGKAIRWEVPSNGGAFEGELDDNARSMKGTWKQGLANLPLELKHSGESFSRSRPQTPVPPFPYDSEDVTFPNTAEGHVLAGTLTLPKNAKRVPAVITISGSGPQDRDEMLFQHRPFAVIADHLTKAGIAVLRYDDRGFGDSTGDFSKATSLDFAGDAWAAVEFLRKRPEIDPDRIGLLGHSEGGMVAPLVAEHHGEVDFMVLLAAPGIPLEDLLAKQRLDIMTSLGISERAIELSNRIAEEMFDLVRSGADEDEIVKFSEENSEQVMALLTEEQRKIFGPLNNLGIEQITTPWFRYFIDFDPGVALRKVTCPVLALNGELDLQVAPKANLEGIARHLREAGNKKVTTREFARLNHLFQHAETGSPREYPDIEETMSPEVLDAISDWIREVTGM